VAWQALLAGIPFPIFDGGFGRADSGGQPGYLRHPFSDEVRRDHRRGALPKDVWFYKNGAGRICV